jgi:2-C-methyl-D-erythritol 4-phosphate cytidylyltransferase
VQPRQSLEALWVIVPAAGQGARMGAPLPKQYLPLLNQTVIEITLARLLALSNVKQTIVSLHSEDYHWQTLSCAQNPKIQTVIGGKERSDSVLAALKHIQQQARDRDWVLVHDAARPCVMTETIEAMLTVLKDEEIGGILAIPSDDTLKHVTNQLIQSTLNRQVIWRAQTPQVFRYGLLYRSLHRAITDNHPVTDDASAIEMAGYQPQVLVGHKDNIKITHPEDLIFAEFILKKQKF